MGYRSEVAIVLSSKGVDIFNKALHTDLYRSNAQLYDEVYELWEKDFDEFKRAKDTGDECRRWSAIKWYEDDEVIEWVMNTLENKLPIEDYKYIRIGEDYSDIEEFGTYLNGRFQIYVIREIGLDILSHNELVKAEI